MRARHRLRQATVLMSALFALGCGSVELSPETRASIRTVSVRERVDEEASAQGDLPGTDVTTRGSQYYATIFTAPIGAVLDVIDWSETKERRQQLVSARFRRAKLEVGEIVRDEFVNGLQKWAAFDVVGARGGDAQFHLSAAYGLSDGYALLGRWKPYLTVEGVLIDRQGSVLWQSSASVSAKDERLPGFEFPFRKPDRLRSSYRRAARIVTQDLMKHLAGS